MGSTEMEGAEGGCLLGLERPCWRPKELSLKSTQQALGVKKLGVQRDFWLNQREGLEGAGECLYVSGIMRLRFEVNPWWERSVWGFEWSGEGETRVRSGLKAMSATWMLFHVALGRERRTFKPPPAQRGP